MKIKHTDENTLEFVDNACMSYMTLVTHRLNQTLIKNNIDDKALRQEICESFLFGLTYDLDAGWFIEAKTKLFPKVCFAERASPIDDENLGQIQTLNVPTEASSWHEYAMGVVTQYFEELCEEPEGIRTGSYEIEN